jgi:protein SCO1/2
MTVIVSMPTGPEGPRSYPISSKILALACLATLTLGCSNKSVDQLPVIAELPAPSLVDQDGDVFDRDAMQGQLWVTAFVFTHCRATCPRLTAQMKKLQARVSDIRSAHFLSVSVDPRNDTPEVIKAYMSENRLNETNWRFVTGDESAVQEFVVDGFKVGYGRTRWSTELTHSNSFALVDERGRIRGYYRSDDEGLLELERDLRALAR